MWKGWRIKQETRLFPIDVTQSGLMSSHEHVLKHTQHKLQGEHPITFCKWKLKTGGKLPWPQLSILGCFFFFCSTALKLLLITYMLRANCQAAWKASISITTTKSRIKETYYLGGFGQDRNDARKPDWWWGRSNCHMMQMLEIWSCLVAGWKG